MKKNNFEKALHDALSSEYEMNIEEEIPEEHKFSLDFEKEMNELINTPEQSTCKVVINRVGKVAVCMATVIAFVLSTKFTNYISASENDLSDFIIHTYETHSKIKANPRDDDPTTLEELYEITYDISDFEEHFCFEDEYSRYVGYLKNKNIEILLCQETTDMYFPAVNTEFADILKEDINGHEAICFTDFRNNYTTLIWYNGDYVLEISSNLDKNIVIQIAESVQKVE